MKQRMSTNGRIFRVLFTVLTAAFALCILTFTTSAANTLTETSMTYDFSTYSGNNDAVLAGWSIQGEVPSGTSKKANVSVSANMVGVTDYVTRDGAGIYENLEFVYTVPQSDRIALSEYDVITFSRYFGSASGFARTGAEYMLILVTDGGDRVEISRPWITLSETLDTATVTVEIQNELEALDGDAVLKEIIFKPYANPEEFALDVVEQSQALLEFYIGHVAFFKAVDMPEVSAEPDTYDGVSVTEHTGKITGLNPSLTYEYKLTYASEWISVTGVSEIPGLEGATWRIRQAADEENGLLASRAVAVDVPRTVHNLMNYSADRVKNSDFDSATGTAPVIGTWISTDTKPYSNTSGRLTISSDLSLLSGASAYNAAVISDEGSYYRRLINVFDYALKPEEQIDVSVAHFSFGIMYANNFPYASYDDVMGRALVYVSGQDEPLVIPNLRYSSSVKNYSINLGTEFPDATGNIERIVFIPWHTQTALPQNSNNNPQIVNITMSERLPAPAPDIFEIDMEDGTYKISGFKASCNYEMSADGVTWTQLPAGTTSLTGITGGIYYFRQMASDDYLTGEISVIKLAEQINEIPAGLSVIGNSIQGFDSKLSYEYRKYSLTNENEYTALTAGATKLEGLTAGLWEVRYVTESGNSKPAYYLVYGENNGTIAFKANYREGGDKWDGNTGFAAGSWTNSLAGCYLNNVATASGIRLSSSWKPSLEQEALDAFYFSYQFTDDEIIPVSYAKPIKYYASFDGGSPYSNPSTTRVRYYVAGGDVDYYDVITTFTDKASATTNDLSTVAPDDAPGYIVGIRIWPYAAYSEGTTLTTTTTWYYPILKVYGYDTGETDPRLMSRIIIGEERPQELVLEEVNANLYQKYKITGFDADKLYEYSVNGSSWTALAEGTTELGPLVGGTYYVRYAATSTADASNAVTITTPTMTPAFITTDISYFPSVLAQDFQTGLWTAYPNKINVSTAAFVAHINANTPLNTVRYAYTFSPKHRFTINEYPYFVMDFNSDLYHMGIDKGYIEGAQIEVDVYFEGSTQPYTITGDWAGYHKESTGFTKNKILVDLLSLAPEYGDCTVRAFVIRPYSNITLSPSDYNTSSASSRYILFRVWNVGFYSTEENIAAITSATHEQVNEFEGITLITADGYADDGIITEDELTVVARYSDGTEKQVDSSTVVFDIPVLESAGTYSVTASYRGASDSESLIIGIDTDSIEIFSYPNKTLYYVGETFNADGLSFNYTTVDGDVVNVNSGYTVVPTVFEAAGTVEVPVYYLGREFVVSVEIVPVGYELSLAKDSAYTFDTDVRRIYGVSELTTVADIIASFTGSVAVFDRTGNDVTAQTDTVVGSDFTVATLIDGNIADYGKIVIKGDVNGNGKIDANDFILIKRAYLNAIVLSGGSLAFEAADVNGNGSIETNDYLQIKNHWRGRIDLFN